MIIAGTGHRPNKIGGYKEPNPIYNYVCSELEKILLQEKPDKVISGMALGFDMWLAEIAIKLGIPLIAAVPFKGQERIWPNESKKRYHSILDKASEIVIVSQGSYSAIKMHIRNHWMVDKSDALIACWDGSKGGTYECIQYAKNQCDLRPGYIIHKINPALYIAVAKESDSI